MLASEVGDEIATSPWPGRLVDAGWAVWIGPRKVGKGLTIADSAARFTRGWAMPPDRPFSVRDIVRPPQKVVIISPEDADEEIKRRLVAAGADLTMVEIMSRIERGQAANGNAGPRFKVSTDMPVLGAKIEELGGVGAVFMDPLMAVAGATVSFNQQGRNKVFEPMEDSAAYYGYCGVMAGHFTKGWESITANSNKSLEDYVGGSAGLLDFARLGCVLMPDKQSGLVNLQTLTSNAGYPTDEVRYKVIANGMNDPDARVEWVPAAADVSSPAGMQDIQARILRELVDATRPVTNQEMVTLVGLSYKLVKRLMADAESKGLVAVQNGGYVLPAATDLRATALPAARPGMQAGPGPDAARRRTAARTRNRREARQ